jgi:hypothetical protein
MKAAFPIGLKNASIGPTTCQENWIFYRLALPHIEFRSSSFKKKSGN